jgi:hypothetical protein
VNNDGSSAFKDCTFINNIAFEGTTLYLMNTISENTFDSSHIESLENPDFDAILATYNDSFRDKIQTSFSYLAYKPGDI